MTNDPRPSQVAPSNSTIASVGIGLPVTVFIAWLFKQFAGIDMPGEVQAAVAVIISAGSGYFFSGGRKADTV